MNENSNNSRGQKWIQHSMVEFVNKKNAWGMWTYGSMSAQSTKYTRKSLSINNSVIINGTTSHGLIKRRYDVPYLLEEAFVSKYASKAGYWKCFRLCTLRKIIATYYGDTLDPKSLHLQSQRDISIYGNRIFITLLITAILLKLQPPI